MLERAQQTRTRVLTLLEAITLSGDADLILHPVTLALLKLKWEGFARRDVLAQLVSYLLFLLSWTVATQLVGAHLWRKKRRRQWGEAANKRVRSCTTGDKCSRFGALLPQRHSHHAPTS